MVWRGVGAGDSKKKGRSILFLGQSTHRQKADILSFPSRGRPPPTFFPNHCFSVTWRKKQSGTAGYCGTAYAVPRQGNHFTALHGLEKRHRHFACFEVAEVCTLKKHRRGEKLQTKTCKQKYGICKMDGRRRRGSDTFGK